MEISDKPENKSTPVQILSKNEIKNTLSAKKKGGRLLKNILGAHVKETWPSVDDKNKEMLFNEIKKLSFCKCKPKDETLKDDYSSEHRKYVKFGLSEINRHIKNEKCSAVLFDSNIPKVLVSQMMSRSANKNVPVLCIPKLQDFIMEIFNFKSISMAFLKSESRIYDAIISNITSYFDDRYKVVMREEFLQFQKCDNESVEGSPVLCEDVDVKMEKSLPPIVHLPKEHGKRAFIPPESKDEPAAKINKIDTDVLMLDLSANNLLSNKNKSSLKPPVIKRIQPNANRKKELNKKTK